MPKYSVEGNIDFYGELYKLLDDNALQVDDQSQDLCLITNLPLTENYVTLECNHKFNYVPLFKDLVNRKTKHSSLDTQVLKLNELRCPYCRHRESKLLPFYENMGVEKVHGVNFIDDNIVLTKTTDDYFTGNCAYKVTSFDGTEVCCHGSYIKTHADGKNYCYTHLRFLQRKAVKDKLLEKKAAEKALKLEEKNLAKQKLMEEKMKAKAEKKPKNTGENMVLFSPNGCKQALKTGPRKGEICGCKAAANSEFCARHNKNQSTIQSKNQTQNENYVIA